jgi:hypothetical protein
MIYHDAATKQVSLAASLCLKRKKRSPHDRLSHEKGGKEKIETCIYGL